MNVMEVAGLVLGVIPLAVTALKTYIKILDTVKALKRAKQDLEAMIRDLETERHILQNTCELLLSGIVEDEVLNRMIETPCGPDWKTYDDKVHERLWNSTDLFRDRVAEMRSAVEELRLKLCINPDGTVSFRILGFLLDSRGYEIYVKDSGFVEG